MTMAAVTSMLKAKLLQKGLFRPTKMVAPKMPDGSGLLSELPRHTGAGGGRMDPAAQAAADKTYCDEIDKVTEAFGGQRRSVSTAREHAMYARIVGEWCVRSGFGVYVDVVVSEGVSMGAEKEVSVRAAVRTLARNWCGLSAG